MLSVKNSGYAKYHGLKIQTVRLLVFDYDGE